LTNYSHFTFLTGASTPEELVEACAELGLPAMALTDRDGLYGAVRAHVRAQALGLKLILGAEISVDDGSRLTLLVQNRVGYTHLCRLITTGRRRCAKGAAQVTWAEVAAAAPGLLALWGGAQSLLVRAAPPLAVLDLMAEAYAGALYWVLPRHRLEEEVAQEARARAWAARYGWPAVATAEVLYHTAARQPLQDILTCIAHGVRLSEAGTRLRANACHALCSPQEMGLRFADQPAALARSLEVAARCDFSLAALRYVYPSENLPDGRTTAGWLRELAAEGAAWRFGGVVPAAVSEQLARELALIEELDYCGYFLTMVHIVDFCRREGILCQGRGSAANSVLCYCLGITAVDPQRVDLLFERFISRERAEPPDIDLDIEHARREEVIRFVYDTYGRERAAMVCNIVRYRPRSAVREVGKALGIAADSIERFAKALGYFDHDLDPAQLAAVGLAPEVPQHRHWLHWSRALLGFPRHLSIHPGGFLLGHQPIWTLVPIENARREGRTVIQWDKEDIEALGLFKVDLLGLGALHQLRLCFDLLAAHYPGPTPPSMDAIPADDAATYAMLQRADAVGVFQVESRAQMTMLPRLRPKNYYDLVVEIALVRPGPISGGMVHPYLRRRDGLEPVTYPHPSLEPILRKTFGVPLFQEQVMRLAMCAADYSPGEADRLRRDMGAWRCPGRIEAHRERLISRMQAKGIDPAFAERVFAQIKGFADYGFPESHAASFALICYATAYLKCHYPAAFFCSLLNAQPMGFYAPATLVQEARRAGVHTLPIDVAHSHWDCTLCPGQRPDRPALRMGLRYIKGLRAEEAQRLIAARRAAPFTDLTDLRRRAALSASAERLLARANAFASLALDPRKALWQVQQALPPLAGALALDTADELPDFPAQPPWEQMIAAYVNTQHSTQGHPLLALRPFLRHQGLLDAQALRRVPHGQPAAVVGQIICRQRPPTAKGLLFMTLEDEVGLINTVLWPTIAERYKILVRTTAMVGVSGRVQSASGVVHLVAERLWAARLGQEGGAAQATHGRPH